jgi:tubulin polyglutamylase TTLL11
MIQDSISTVSEEQKVTKTHHRKKRFRINTSKCRSEIDLIKQVISTNARLQESHGNRGDLMWFGLAVQDTDLPIPSDMIINRFPGALEASRKKALGENLHILAKYYPSLYNFFPKTYIFPTDREVLEADMRDSSKVYIAKPTAGTHGDGIFLIRKYTDLTYKYMKDINDLVIQEYIHPPMLLYGKKFDLRIYALLTSLNPLCAFLCDEGLARFCTENYAEPTSSNIGNCFMHLTNYTMNKASVKFIHTDELFLPNEGSKQTLTSLYAALENEGWNIHQIKDSIEQIVAKTLIAMRAGLENCYNSAVKHAKCEKLRCFQVMGVDIMLGGDGRPWLIEINANPSFKIDFEIETSPGVTQSIVSELDLYVKRKVIEDALEILQVKRNDQMKIERLGSYKRIQPSGREYDECGLIFDRMRDLFEKLSYSNKSNYMPSNKFRR